MDSDEIATRIKFLEKATNLLAEDRGKTDKRTGSRGPIQPPKPRVPSGAITIKLPAYNVHYMGVMRRVDVAALESDPDLHAYMRAKYPEIFVE